MEALSYELIRTIDVKLNAIQNVENINYLIDPSKSRVVIVNEIEKSISNPRITSCESQRLVVVIVRRDCFNSSHRSGANLLIVAIVARKVDYGFPILFHVHAACGTLVDNIDVST